MANLKYLLLRLEDPDDPIFVLPEGQIYFHVILGAEGHQQHDFRPAEAAQHIIRDNPEYLAWMRTWRRRHPNRTESLSISGPPGGPPAFARDRGSLPTELVALLYVRLAIGVGMHEDFYMLEMRHYNGMHPHLENNERNRNNNTYDVRFRASAIFREYIKEDNKVRWKHASKIRYFARPIAEKIQEKAVERRYGPGGPGWQKDMRQFAEETGQNVDEMALASATPIGRDDYKYPASGRRSSSSKKGGSSRRKSRRKSKRKSKRKRQY